MCVEDLLHRMDHCSRKLVVQQGVVQKETWKHFRRERRDVVAQINVRTREAFATQNNPATLTKPRRHAPTGTTSARPKGDCCVVLLVVTEQSTCSRGVGVAAITAVFFFPAAMGRWRGKLPKQSGCTLSHTRCECYERSVHGKPRAQVCISEEEQQHQQECNFGTHSFAFFEPTHTSDGGW